LQDQPFQILLLLLERPGEVDLSVRSLSFTTHAIQTIGVVPGAATDEIIGAGCCSSEAQVARAPSRCSSRIST